MEKRRTKDGQGAEKDSEVRKRALSLEWGYGELDMTGFKVLLVDDEPAVLSVLQWALQDLGCAVAVALGGRAALARLHNESFDMMITDLIMPDLDGFFLLRMAGELNPKMKLIVMTGSPEPLPNILSKMNRLDGFMRKPFGLKRLKKAIQRCMSKKDGDPGIPAFFTVEHQRFSVERIEEHDQ